MLFLEGESSAFSSSKKESMLDLNRGRWDTCTGSKDSKESRNSRLLESSIQMSLSYV